MIKRVLFVAAGFAAVVAAQTSSFPASVATDASLKVQVNGKQTNLSATINSVASTATVASCSAVPNNSLASIGTEIIAVASCTSTTLTMDTSAPGCTSGRACDGTTATSHNSGATVSWYADAWHHNSLRVNVEAMQTALYTGASPTWANITATNNVNAKAVNFYDNSGSGVSGHFGMDAAIGIVNKYLFVRDTSGNVMLTFDPTNAAIISNIGFAVGTGGSPKNFTVSGTAAITGATSITGALTGSSPSVFAITTAGRALSGTSVFNDASAYGVYGSSTYGIGTYGNSTFGTGVLGNSDSGPGLTAQSNSGTALQVSSTSGVGAHIDGQLVLTGSHSGGYAMTVASTVGGGIFVSTSSSTVINGSTSGSSTSAILTDNGGTCTIHGASGISCVSDLSVKTGIKDIAPSLSKVLRLRPVEYQMKSNGQHSAGLIAQDVQKQFPLAVGSTDDGKLTLSYQEIVPYLIKAIQEQQHEIAVLKGRK